MTFGTLLTRYIEHLESVEPIGRSKRSTIHVLTHSPIGSVSIHALTAPVIIEHCRQRKLAGISTATINGDLVYIRTACKTGRAMFGLDIDMQAVEDATAQLKSLGWISGSRKRTRRPTEDELTRLRAYFVDRSARRNNALPMADLMDFAITSCRRQEEITKLRWDTIRDSDRTAVISDLKHPRHKTGNDRRFKLLQDAWDIIQRQPRTESPLVFPFVSTTLGAAFTSACRTLEIADLHFHDLRHHGVSLLFERGYSIQEVQMISLHDSWTTLQRYTHLQPGDVQDRSRSKP